MMNIYCSTKRTYTDCILFYPLSDFHEIFFEVALIAL